VRLKKKEHLDRDGLIRILEDSLLLHPSTNKSTFKIDILKSLKNDPH
jgi:hypothetical protein